jgi:hypothetical protein
MQLQHNRALSHFHKEVSDFFNIKIPETWITWGETIIWPPRSPDLTAFDFFLCVRQGCCVSPTVVTTLPEHAGKTGVALAIDTPSICLITCGLILDTNTN